MFLQNKNIKGVIFIDKEKRLTIRVSEKMLREFNEALKETEHSKSEILRECIREYIRKNKKKVYDGS